MQQVEVSKQCTFYSRSLAEVVADAIHNVMKNQIKHLINRKIEQNCWYEMKTLALKDGTLMRMEIVLLGFKL